MEVAQEGIGKVPSARMLLKQHTDGWVAAGLGIASWALYRVTMAPSVLPADSGEFQLAAPLAGIAHPTGYPLYMVLGWIWSHLVPFGSAAFKMNLFSVVTAAGAIMLVYATSRRLLRVAGLLQDPLLTRGVALAIAALLAVSRAFWSQAIIAEVYALNLLLLAWQLYLLLGHIEHPDERLGLIPMAIVTGLGLTHHRTALLFLPGLVLTLWLVQRKREGIRRRPRHLLLVIAACILPFVLYLYVPLRAPHSPYLDVPLTESESLRLYKNDVPSFLDYTLGRSFEGAIRPSILSQERLRSAFEMLNRQFTLFGIGLGLVGLIWLIWSRRWLLLAATLPSYLGLVGFNLAYDIGDIFAFFIPTYLIWALWIGLGAAWFCGLAGRLVARWRGSPAHPNPSLAYRLLRQNTQRLAGLFVVALLFVLVGYSVSANFAFVDRSEDWSAWATWQRILAQPLPEGSVLISNDRDEIMPLWYFQHIDGRRPDLIGLFPKIVADSTWDNIGTVIDQALASGRPVYLIKPMTGLDLKFDVTAAQGNLVQVSGVAQRQELLRETNVDLEQSVRLVGYSRSPYSPAPGSSLTVTLWWQPLRRLPANYISFVQLLDMTNNRVAGSDQQPGGDYYPSSLWQVGEMLRDTHRFTVPADLTPGTYQLYVGLYLYPSMDRLGDANLGNIGIKSTIETEIRVPPHPMKVYFDDKILFLGYEYRKEGQSILLSLEWQALREMEHNYTTFVHLLDAQEAIVSQADSQPLGGTYPTSIWDSGEVVIDAYRLPIEMATPAGEYRLLIGLYRLDTLTRLPVYGEDGQPLEDSLALQTIRWP